MRRKVLRRIIWGWLTLIILVALFGKITIATSSGTGTALREPAKVDRNRPTTSVTLLHAEHDRADMAAIP